MKSAILLFAFFVFSQSGFSMELSFKDHVEVKKITVSSMSPEQFLNPNHEGRRMVAGKFENNKNLNKKNYLESLRSKLGGYKGIYTF